MCLAASLQLVGISSVDPSKCCSVCLPSPKQILKRAETESWKPLPLDCKAGLILSFGTLLRCSKKRIPEVKAEAKLKQNVNKFKAWKEEQFHRTWVEICWSFKKQRSGLPQFNVRNSHVLRWKISGSLGSLVSPGSVDCRWVDLSAAGSLPEKPTTTQKHQSFSHCEWNHVCIFNREMTDVSE